MSGGKNNKFAKALVFDYDPNTNKSKCLIESCGKLLSGDNSSNLMRHVRLCHVSVAKNMNLLEDDIPEDGPSNTKKSKKNNPDDIIKAAVGLVTVRGLPLRFFDFDETKTLLKSTEQKFNVKLSKPIVVDYLKETTKKIVEKIKSELKFKLISLKMVAASRHGRHVLGVNCQFMKNGVIMTRTLGVLELFSKQTAANLRAEILKILQLYEIEIHQIYSITTDNGSNMIAATKLLRETQELLLAAVNCTVSCIDNDSDEEEIPEEAVR